MANVAVTGFIPSRVVDGGPITYKRGRVLTNNTTAIFRYDAVKTTSSGDYLVASATNTAVASVATGASYVNANNQRVQADYLPAATLYTSTGVDPDNASFISVVDNTVNTQFRCSVDAAIAITDLNINYVMTLGTGSTTTGLSGHVLTATGRATTNTFPWRVEEFVLGSSESDPDAANCHVYARINRSLTEPALSDGTGT